MRFLDEPSWPAVALVGGVCLVALLGCDRGEAPDEAAFAALVARTVLEEKLMSGGKTVVLREGTFRELPEELQNAIVSRLEESDAEWKMLRLESGVTEMPGVWEDMRGLPKDGLEPGREAGLYLVNRTHVLVTVHVSEDAGERIVEWSQKWGKLAGKWREVTFRWNGESWNAVDRKFGRL